MTSRGSSEAKPSAESFEAKPPDEPSETKQQAESLHAELAVKMEQRKPPPSETAGEKI